MPMSFPDMDSLKFRAAVRGFRQPHENELEKDYRTSFADFMRDIDRVESSEIRSGKGWDQQEPEDLLKDFLGSDQALEKLLNDLMSPDVNDNDYVKNLLAHELGMYDLKNDGNIDLLTFHEFEFDPEQASLEAVREALREHTKLIAVQLNHKVNKITVMNIGLFIRMKEFFRAYVIAEQDSMERDNEMFAFLDEIEENQNVNDN